MFLCFSLYFSTKHPAPISTSGSSCTSGLEDVEKGFGEEEIEYWRRQTLLWSAVDGEADVLVQHWPKCADVFCILQRMLFPSVNYKRALLNSCYSRIWKRSETMSTMYMGSSPSLEFQGERCKRKLRRCKGTAHVNPKSLSLKNWPF